MHKFNEEQEQIKQLKIQGLQSYTYKYFLLEEQAKSKREIESKVKELKSQMLNNINSYKNSALKELSMNEERLKSDYEHDREKLDSEFNRKLDRETDHIKADLEVKNNIKKLNVQQEVNEKFFRNRQADILSDTLKESAPIKAKIKDEFRNKLKKAKIDMQKQHEKKVKAREEEKQSIEEDHKLKSSK